MDNDIELPSTGKIPAFASAGIIKFENPPTKKNNFEIVERKKK